MINSISLSCGGQDMVAIWCNTAAESADFAGIFGIESEFF